MTLGVLGQPIEEAIALLVIFGIAFPLLALLCCIRTPLPSPPAAAQAGEAWMMAGLVAWICFFLAIKGPLLAGLLPDDADPRLREIENTTIKLVAFVALPLLLYRARYGALPSAGASGMSAARQWLLFAVVGAAIFSVMLLISRGTRELFAGEFTAYQKVAGLLLSFAWMSLAAGVVEEVFFRWLLQSRIAAITGSQLSAICIATLAFGLAHAPGMWLRGAGVAEGIGDDPGLALTVAYSVTTQGVAGFLFAVLWARTRSLPLLIALHGLVDASSNGAEFIRTWQL
ncbi:MAG: CPBP family intramembrane glutamic endopeptidase [Gammaproteobacteria bacterium]